MKRALAICSVLAMVFSAGNALAAEKNTFYIGGGLGGLTLGASASLSTSDPNDSFSTAHYKESESTQINYTFLAGFNVFPWLAAELQFATTSKDKWLGANLDISTQTIGLYGVYQAGDDLFARLRLGLAKRDIEFTTTPAFGNQTGVTGAIGASVGQKLGVGNFELMYMYYPKMKIESDDLYDLTNIKFSDRVDTSTWTLAYTYTF